MLERLDDLQRQANGKCQCFTFPNADIRLPSPRGRLNWLNARDLNLKTIRDLSENRCLYRLHYMCLLFYRVWRLNPDKLMFLFSNKFINTQYK